MAYTFQEPERGEVIIFYPPGSRQGIFIKRLIALPGDTVEIKGGTVYVNDSPLDEPYIKEPPRYTFNKYEIPPDSYFVLGDNRNNSGDSHTGWVVPRKSIIGKVWISIWPPTRWGLLPSYPLGEQIAEPVSAGLSAISWIVKFTEVTKLGLSGNSS